MNFTEAMRELANAEEDKTAYTYFWGSRCSSCTRILLREEQCRALEALYWSAFKETKSSELEAFRHCCRYLNNIGCVSARQASQTPGASRRIQAGGHSATTAANTRSALELLEKRGLVKNHRVYGIVGRGWPWSRRYVVRVIGADDVKYDLDATDCRFGDLLTINYGV